MIYWVGPRNTTLEVADGGRRGHLLTQTDLSVCLQGSYENLLQYILYYQQEYLFFFFSEREYLQQCQTPTQPSMSNIAS